jgi:hypothetical protein
MGARATMTLGKINGKLRRRLAAGDIPGIIAQIEELAQGAAQIGTEDYGLRQVLANVEQATQVIGRSGSVSQIDVTCAALLQASNRTPSPLLTATFHALRDVLLAAKMGKTAETAEEDKAAEEDERIEQLSIEGSERIDAALQARDPMGLADGIELLR